jgi:hypothetical protein
MTEPLTIRDLIAILSLAGGVIFFIFAAGELKGKYAAKIENSENEIIKLRKEFHKLNNEVGVLMAAKGLSRYSKYEQTT